MSNLSAVCATNALEFLTYVALTRQHHLKLFEASRVEIDEDEEEDIPASILKSIYDVGGNDETSKMPILRPMRLRMSIPDWKSVLSLTGTLVEGNIVV